MSTIHVKFRNESNDYELSDLFPQSRLEALGVAESSVNVESLNDTQIKTAVAGFLDVSIEDFNGYTVSRHENGNATLHPEPTFG